MLLGGSRGLETGKIGPKSAKIAGETPEKRLKRSAPASKPDQTHHLHVINRPGPRDGQRSPTSAPTGPRGVGCPAPRIGYFCAEPSWSPRAPRARRPPREHPEWPSYGHYGRPTARRRHHGTRTSAHGHPRAVPSLGGAGSRRPRPRIRPPPKKNSKTLIAPRTPELTD